jgi:hypothetical protein
MLILHLRSKTAKLKEKETWPTFKSIVGSSKTVLSAFCITFGDLINDFGNFIEQFGDRKIKYILVILYAI